MRSLSKVRNAESPTQRRRGSSVGQINVGDTAVPGFSTIKVTASNRDKLKARMRELSAESQSDRAILRKILVAYVELSYRHFWLSPLLVLSISCGLYFFGDQNSSLHNFLERLMTVSYHIEGTENYGKGVNDFYFVAFYAVFLTFFREFMMVCILRPMAYFLGVKKPAKVKRFMEQTYAMVYYGFSGPFGLWVMSQTPLWFFETTPFYLEYPHKTHDWYFKVYYLGQAAFWVQQSVVLVLQLEKPRKDYYELILHHIVTIALIWCSYRFHFTWMGLAVYVTMDVSDFFLAFSKTLNYLNSPASGPFFAFFVFVWIYLRHYINLRILWSVLTEFRTVGEWELNWDTQQYKSWISQPVVFGLLFALQLLNAYWLFLIIRILYRYVLGGVAEDDRSDGEDEESEYYEKEREKYHRK
ncbi:longevity assurance proteins LAG1/LAC1 [Metschnikowia bicuspidata]|uniref:Longevity assurance proteins LAG1/LAC1 n=1 Tax=Metschnikowia bicuspidata TaxID=27322 RepID=A0A4P9ZEM9_9ASCO|nr:longevity assurance proteins LAG1/LAC1 [Metschnikowia bicuspidata]